MPWRNGLGTTVELARQVCDGSPGFIWRISRADVASSGPFSNFSGVDRILFLLSGNGFKLDFGASSKTLTSRYQSANFPGDEPTDAN